MAIKKRFTSELNISGEHGYSCKISKTYTDVYTLNQELGSADAPVTLLTSQSESSLTNTATQINSPQAILIKNVSNVTAEILMATQDWKDNSSVDVRNSVDVGGGGATGKRSWSFLLPAGEFMYLPNARAVSYASSDADPYESAALAGVGTISQILPSAINGGNEYRAVAEITGTTYGGGTAELTNEAVAIAETEIDVDDGDWFKAGDLIMIDSEVMEVESISSNTLTVKRGLLGSTDVAHDDDDALFYFFGNEYLAFDVGKCMTDKQGKFKQRGAFFGYARTGSELVIGLVPGSVAIGPFFTEGGYLDFGLNGITQNTDTGLTASTTYTFHLVCDEYNVDGIDSVSSETAIAFTTDASDTTFNGSANAVLPKIQDAINTQTKTTGSGLLNKSVSIFIHNGDVRVKSNSNNSDTRIGIANVSGTSPFDVGKFPSLSSGVPDLLGTPHGGGTTDTICWGPPSTLAQETITDPVTGKSELNDSAYLFDDGQGNLRYLDRIVGKIDYYKGHCSFTMPSLPEAEFAVSAQSHSAHSGGSNYTSAGVNNINLIKARSVNAIKNTKLEIVVYG